MLFFHKNSNKIFNYKPYAVRRRVHLCMANGNLARAPHVALVMSEANCIDPWQIGGGRRGVR
jgi:hypothetical protein